MMAKSQNSKSRGQIRSVSLPTRSHPTTLRIDEELNKFKSCEPSFTFTSPTTISNGLSELEKLYEYTNDLLSLSSTKQVFSKLEKLVDELSDGSLRLLDTCSGIRDLVSQMKEHIGDVRSCLRRRKGDSAIESSIVRFASFRRKMKKDAKKLIASLKQMDVVIGSESELTNIDDPHVLAVIRVLREVSATSISIFESLLVFLSMPISKPNQTKWSLVSNLIRKGRVQCEGHFDQANELERVDASLSALCKHESSEMDNIQVAQKRLEALEDRVNEIERHLELIFRRLIRTRSSFLDILSY